MSHSRFARLLLVAAAATTIGCGGDGTPTELTYDEACAAVPGCSDPRFDPNAARETIYRVLVVREESGEIRIADVDTVDVLQGNGVPISPAGDSHLLVGLDSAGEALDGQELRFPDELEVSFEDQFEEEHVDLTGLEVDTIGYVRAVAGVTELGVVDQTGDVVARAPLPTTTSAKGRRIGNTESRLTQASQSCSHVRLLEGEADRAFATGMGYYADTELINPGPTQRAVIEGALGRMTPLLCHGVSRIAVGRISGADGVGGIVKQLAAGDLILLNTGVGYSESELAGSEEQRLRMMHTIIHEVAHSTESFLNSEGMTSQDFMGEWSFDSRTVAVETVDNVRLEQGLLIEWQRMQRTFETQGWALPYLSVVPSATAAVRRWEAEQTVESGFMSRYAVKSYAEDIAETTAWAYMGGLFRDAGIPEGIRQTEDFGCQIMRQHTERNVPSRLSAIYTKLFFAKDLGLVHPDDVDRCIGDSLGLPIDSSGFHVWQDTIRLRSYESAVTAGIGTTGDGSRVYQMRAEGEAGFGEETFPASFRLQLDLPNEADIERVPWPRGVYELGLLGDNNLELRLEGAASGNFDVSDGFVLVAEASNKRIAGSIFITRVWRLQAPIPVPEVYDPPLIIRFLIEN